MRQPAVLIGQMAIGPTCGRKAGLIEFGRKRAGFVRQVNILKRIKEDDTTMDLFA